MDFKKDVEIDPGALDVEWIRHPALYAKYAELAADANDTLKRAEQGLKVLRSELSLEIKERDSKATAAMIEAEYRCNKEHIQAKEDYFKAAYDAEMLQNALFALNAKKAALENLVKLHAANYFAGPTEPRNLLDEYRERMRDRQDDSQHEVAEKMQARMSRRTR